MKVLIGINTLTAVEQPVYANHMQFFYRLGRNYPDIDFGLMAPRRMSIDRMRNTCAKIAVDNDFDYLMFIDDDVIVPVECFWQLKSRERDIVCGWTLIRGWPFPDMVFSSDKDQNLKSTHLERGSGLVDVDAVGFSCVLIRVSLLKKVSTPWFVTGPSNTEDIYFCIKSRQEHPETTIACDTNIECAHILGPELIAPWNKDSYMKYYRETYPEMCNEEEVILKTSGEASYEGVLNHEVCEI